MVTVSSSLRTLAGALMNAAGEVAGSMFILEVAAAADAEAFAAADPYRLADVFERVEVRPFELRFGGFS